MIKSLNELKVMWCFSVSIEADENFCLGDKCMAWRWYDECDKFEDCSSWHRLLKGGIVECARRGYCGLAGDKIVP